MFEGTLVILFLIGLGVTLYSVFVMKDKFIAADNPLNQNKIINAEQKLKEQLDEIDKMMDELSKFANHVNDELNQKHKELLFLYEMIDTKYKPSSATGKQEKEFIKSTNKFEQVEEKPKKNKPYIEKQVEKIVEKISDKQSERKLEKIEEVQIPKSEKTIEIKVDIPVEPKFAEEFQPEIKSTPVVMEKEVIKFEDFSKNKKGYSAIYEMSQSGMTIEDIAKELNIGKGEVKLLLELTQKR